MTFGYIGPAVSEEEMFEECGRRMDDRCCLYYKLTNEPKDKSNLGNVQVETWNSTK